jgi:hypothetical protein
MLLKGNLITLALASVFLFAGCSTGYKQRQEERNKIASSSGHYCEFVNGDAHNDVDVELTMQMSKKCDVNKPYTITNYKNASDIFGVIYCCGYQKGKSSAPAASVKPGAPATGDGLE